MTPNALNEMSIPQLRALQYEIACTLGRKMSEGLAPDLEDEIDDPASTRTVVRNTLGY